MQRSNNKTFKLHSNTKGYENPIFVIPAEAGIHTFLDSHFRGNDGREVFSEQKGSALLAALIILLLLTLIGFAAITTSNIEVQISGNQRLANTSLYAAEGAIESIRQELNNSVPPYDDQFILTNGTSASPNPEYSIFGGIKSWPSKGDANRGDKWTVSNPIVPNRNCPVMYVFLVEGRAGLANKRIEVGILAPDYDGCGSSRTEYSGGTS